VRLQRRRDSLCVTAVGFVAEPGKPLPTSWDELGNQPSWSLPSAFRADCAALAVNSSEAFTRQTTAETFQTGQAPASEGVATSRDGTRSVTRKMADTGSVLQASIPEYQALWINRLLPEGRRPTAVSVQTTPSALLCSLAAQPGFCADGDEVAVFVTRTAIFLAGFRNGIPLLFRECPGAAGVAAMREAVRATFGLEESMLDTVFSNNGIIDTRPALDPLLSPVLSQLDLSLDYLKSRLGSVPNRIFLMGDAVGCGALRRILGERLAVPVVEANPFDGLELPAKPVSWKEKYCVGDSPCVFLTALGAALAVLEEAT